MGDPVKPLTKKVMSTKRKQTELSGLLGENVSVRKVRGRVVVTNHRPRPNTEVSPARAAVLARFREAVQYAKQQVELPASEALYQKGVTTRLRSAYSVAMGDYLAAPKVHFIETMDYRGKVGDTIAVKATDDFMVTSVKVVITASDGTVIEEGNAGPDQLKVNIWSYQATVANPSLPGTTIKAVAFDRPGNKATLEVTL